MRRVVTVCVLGGLVAFPGAVFAGGFDIRAGGFVPRAESNLFQDDADLYTRNPPNPLKKTDWTGITGGAEFSTRLARHFELGFHVDGYGRTLQTSYRQYTTVDDREIQQSLRLTVVPVGVSLRLVPTGRRARVAPYAAVGVDLIYWKYEEFGDFLDFQPYDPRQRPIPDSFQSEGVRPGFHVAAGARVFLNHDLALVGEVRYQVAKADMRDDFRGNRLDLGGASATLGMHLRF